MTATVNGQSITITDETLTVSESVGIYECDFTFDASWDTWNKTAVFEGAGATIEMIVVDNKAQIPWEVLKEAGWIKIGVYGTSGGEIKPTVWSDQIYVTAGTVPGSVIVTPTPSIYAQILDLANDAKDIAEDAQDTADDVASDWASVSATATTLSAGSPATATFSDNTFAFGIPKGAKGDTGATGATGATPAFSIGTVSTLETGQSATATITGTAAAPVLNLGLPKGNKGDNGDVANIADAYSTSATYEVGDYCIYSSQLYRCTTAITTAEAWTAAHWTAVELGEDVSTLRSALYNLGDSAILPYSLAYTNGDIDGNGNEVPSTTWQRTDFILIEDLLRVKFFKNTSTRSLYIFIYDANKGFLSRTTQNADFMIDYDLYVTSYGGAYVRFVRLKTDTWSVALISNLVTNETFAPVMDKTEELFNENTVLYNMMYQNAGTIRNNEFGISELIEIPDNRTVLLTHSLSDTHIATIHAFDANGNYLDYYNIYEGTDVSRDFPVGAKYIRVPFNYIQKKYMLVKDTLGHILWDKPFDTWNEKLSSSYDSVQGKINYTSGDIIALHPKTEWEPILANFNYSIDPNQTAPPVSFGDDPFVMFFCSDVHSVPSQMARLVKFRNEYADYIKDSFVGGDVVDLYSNGYAWWTECGAQMFIPVVGNHETLVSEDVYVGNKKVRQMPYVSAKACYEMMFEPFLSYMNLTDIPEDKCYWYKDYSDSKVRVIGLDDYHWKDIVVLEDYTTSNVYPDGGTVDNGEQETWFRSVLASAKTNNYYVIIIHHTPVRFTLFDTPFTNYEFHNNICTPVEGKYLEMVSIVQDFIEGGGKFLLWMTGHIHQDAIGTVLGYSDQLQMTIDTVRFGRNIGGTVGGVGDAFKIKNTMCQDCAEVLCVDTYTKHLTLKRVGCEYDRNGRHIGTLVWDFENRRISYSD